VVLTTGNRNITLDRIAGDVSVTNHNGTIELTAAPSLGNITLADRNGTVKLTMPDRSGFSMQAATTNGDIDSELPLSQTESGNTKTLAGSVGGGGPLVRITTANGDISLTKAAVAAIPLTGAVPPRLTLAPQAPPVPTPSPRAAHAAKAEENKAQSKAQEP
jgi:hypothetical protein